MSQIVLTGNSYLAGRSYPTIVSETVIEIKKGSTWNDEVFVKGNFTGWNINFYIAKIFGESRIAVGRIEGIQFGDFVEPILDENGNPVLDEGGNPTYENLDGYTYFKLIIDSEVTTTLEVTPIAFKEILQPKPGKDYWQADLEASKIESGILKVEPLFFDLTPVVVRGQV